MKRRLTAIFLTAVLGIGGGYTGITLLQGEPAPKPPPVTAKIEIQPEIQTRSTVPSYAAQNESDIPARQSWYETNARLPWAVQRIIHSNDTDNLPDALKGFEGGKEAALFVAAQDEQALRSLKFIVDSGADIHAEQDKALRYAAYFGNVEAVRFLLKKGADPKAMNGEALLNVTSAKDDGRRAFTDSEKKFSVIEKMLRDNIVAKEKPPALKR